MTATGEFKVTNWNQIDLDGIWNGKNIMKVDAIFEVSGEINGHISVAYLMYYANADSTDSHAGTAQYTGYLAFSGKVDNNEGAFILQDCGVYANSVPLSTFTIVSGSGTGELHGVAGDGKYYAKNGKMIIELEYTH